MAYKLLNDNKCVCYMLYAFDYSIPAVRYMQDTGYLSIFLNTTNIINNFQSKYGKIFRKTHTRTHKSLNQRHKISALNSQDVPEFDCSTAIAVEILKTISLDVDSIYVYLDG